MKRLIAIITIIIIISCVTGISANAQSDALDIFNPLTGKVWKGHYVDSEDSIYTHLIEWEYLLGSKAVKETKTVDELDFQMITYYYYDWENKQISFLSLLNKDMVSSGHVTYDDSKIVLTGMNYFNGGSQEFRKTLTLDDSGVLTDVFISKKGAQWYKGHVIEYR